MLSRYLKSSSLSFLLDGSSEVLFTFKWVMLKWQPVVTTKETTLDEIIILHSKIPRMDTRCHNQTNKQKLGANSAVDKYDGSMDKLLKQLSWENSNYTRWMCDLQWLLFDKTLITFRPKSITRLIHNFLSLISMKITENKTYCNYRHVRLNKMPNLPGRTFSNWRQTNYSHHINSELQICKKNSLNTKTVSKRNFQWTIVSTVLPIKGIYLFNKGRIETKNRTGTSQVGAISKAQKYSRNYWNHLEKIFFFFKKSIWLKKSHNAEKPKKRSFRLIKRLLQT